MPIAHIEEGRVPVPTVREENLIIHRELDKGVPRWGSKDGRKKNKP